MLAPTQHEKWTEIESSIRQIEPHTRTLDMEQRSIAGVDYGDGLSDGEPLTDEPENHRSTWIRQFHAENSLSRNQCVIEPGGQEWPLDRTIAIEQAANRMANQASVKKTMHRCVTDYALRMAVTANSLRSVPGYERSKNPPLICTTKRIPFGQYVADSACWDREDGQFESHRVSRPIDGVIEEAKANPALGWNLDVLEEIKANLSSDKLKLKSGIGKQVNRKDLVYWPMWERGYQCDDECTPEKGYFGTVHYVLDESQGPLTVRNIRASEPWFGHRTGPYAIGAAMWVGDLPIPVSPLVNTGPQAAWVNDMARALMLSIINFKSVIGTTDAQNAALLQAAKNGDVVTFLNAVDIRTVVANVSAGGLEQQFIVGFQMALESLQRNSGTYQNRQGSVQAEATATAINDAALGFQSSMAFWSDGYKDFQRQIFEKWAFWIDCSPEVKSRIGPLPMDLQQKFGSPYINVKGGYAKGSKWSAMDHELLDLRMSPYSGQPQNEQTMTANLNLLMAWLTSIAALPPPMQMAMDVQAGMRMFSRARGFREAERLIDAPLFHGLTGALLQMQNTPEPHPQPQPRAQVSLGGVASATGGNKAGARPVQTQSKPMQIGMPPPSAGAGAPKPAAKPPAMVGAGK